MVEKNIKMAKKDFSKFKDKVKNSNKYFDKLVFFKIIRFLIICGVIGGMLLLNNWRPFLLNEVAETIFLLFASGMILYGMVILYQFFLCSYYYKFLTNELIKYSNNEKIEYDKFVEKLDNFLQILSSHTLRSSKQFFGVLTSYRGIQTRFIKNVDVFCDVSSTILLQDDKNNSHNKTISIIRNLFFELANKINKGYFKESYVNIFRINELIADYNNLFSNEFKEVYSESKSEINMFYNTKFERRELILRNIIYFFLYAIVFLVANYILQKYFIGV